MRFLRPHSCFIRRESDPHVRAAVGAVRGPGSAAVRFGDEPYDRQPEAGTAAAAGVVRAAEAVERPFEERFGKPCTMIDDMQFEPTFGFDCVEHDLAPS